MEFQKEGIILMDQLSCDTIAKNYWNQEVDILLCRAPAPKLLDTP